jgi:hypothetical protein
MLSSPGDSFPGHALIISQFIRHFDFYQRPFVRRPADYDLPESRRHCRGNGPGREVIMLRVRQLCGMLVLSSAVLVLSGAPDATAQKLSYEDAYAKCKADLDRTYPSGSTSTTGRNTRGAACMKQMGYRLKKSGTF